MTKRTLYLVSVPDQKGISPATVARAIREAIHGHAGFFDKGVTVKRVLNAPPATPITLYDRKS